VMSSTLNHIDQAVVIDDEAFMRKLLERQLQSVGCRAVSCFECGTDALDMLVEHGERVSLLLCDLQMPVMDGIEVVRRLGQMSYRGALVLVSGEDTRTLLVAEKLAKAHGLNVLGVLHKPVKPEQLKMLVANAAKARSQPLRSSNNRDVSVQELAEAIRLGQLVNHYQPKVCLRTGRVVGMEALVRWQHPVLGLVYPDAFVAKAEEHGLIDDLTKEVLAGSSGAMRHLRQWTEAGLELHVAVNVSMDNLHDLTLPDFIAQAAQDAGVGLGHLVLEITESRLTSDMIMAADILARLRLKRLRLSIDDFGTGYSSLAQLNDLPFDELKVDRRFVNNACRDHGQDSILEASMNLARNLGMQTIGEGVETEDDWRHLQRRGCHVAQGYWIAKPMPVDAVCGWVAQWEVRRPSLPGVQMTAVETAESVQ
jgi:EAL domain-containing protein (putative c-di-GMP-specific phosphodiesterase class I)/FixJ family two-component response regulator